MPHVKKNFTANVMKATLHSGSLNVVKLKYYVKHNYKNRV